MKQVLFETDWLASNPVFYNEKTGRASRNINDVIDWTRLELHPEGVNNYLDFGYSILEQTPVRDVRFLRHSSRLWVDEEGGLSAEYLDDPVERWMDYRLSEEDIFDLIRERVRKWRAKQKSGITVTDSGFSVEKIEATLTLPPAEGILTKEPLTLRTMFLGGRWYKILT